MTISKQPIRDNQPTIQRGRHDREHPYVIIARSSMQDPTISFKARGLLAYLLTMPDDWKTSVRQVAQANGVGKDQVYSALKELIEAGYAARIETKDEAGRFLTSVYEFYEEKRIQKKTTVSGNPDTEVPDTASPDEETPTLLNSNLTEEGSTKEEGSRVLGKGRVSSNLSAPTDSQARPVGAAGPPKLAFCFTSNSFVGITEQDRADWRLAYPSVKLDAELAAMRQWLLGNPAKSHKTLWRKFIIGWLQKAQARAVQTEAYASQAKKGKSRETFDAQGNSHLKPYEGLF